jgi:hypothetical protein
MKQISKIVGIRSHTMGSWGVTTSPRLHDFERALAAVGYRLVIVKDQP